MIDIVKATKPPKRPYRPKLKLPLVDVLRALRDLAPYTPEPREIAEFVRLLQAMGPDAATTYLLGKPPAAAWILRLLSRLPEPMRVIGTGIGVAEVALLGKAVLTDG